MASAATTATSPALTMTTMPYAVLSSEPSGTRTSALTTPVAATTANSHTAALAYSRTSPRIAAGSCRQATAARRVYSSIPAHITAGSRWVTDSRAPPTGTMPSGCARTASAAVTASSGSTLSPGRRSRRATAASANAAHSRPAISVWPVVSSGATVGCSRSASRSCPLATTMASAAVAARPSSDERSAHGGGSGAGAVPRYCRARPRPARPPSAPASPASISQRSTAMRPAASTAAAMVSGPRAPAAGRCARRGAGSGQGARATSWHRPARACAAGTPGPGRPPVRRRAGRTRGGRPRTGTDPRCG